MECGKLRSDGSPIFYFIIDPVTPDDPNDARVRRFFVVTHIDSYVEAYYFLARQMAIPSATLDETVRRWHALYTRVFGSIDLEVFRKTMQSVPLDHFALEASEENARKRAEVWRDMTTMAGTVRGASSRRSADRDDHSAMERSATQRSAVERNDRRHSASAVSYREHSAERSVRRYSDSAAPHVSDVQASRAQTGNHAQTPEAEALFNEHQLVKERKRLEALARLDDDEYACRGKGGAAANKSTRPHPSTHSTTLFESRVERSRLDDRERAALGRFGGILTEAPVRDEDAKVELHRLRAELADAHSAATLERSRAKVNALSDAERAALLYQLEEARQEATLERANAKEASERLRHKVQQLEDRVQTLMETHDKTLRERSAAEYDRLTQVEQQFLEREQALQKEYEAAVHDRDRKLAKCVSRVKVFEQNLQDALDRIEEQKTKLQESNLKLAEVTNERTCLEEDNRRLQRQMHSLEMQVEDANRSMIQAEEGQRTSSHEAASLKVEVMRLRRELERYASFSHSLHRELQVLDDSAITAAETLRRKILAQRDRDADN